MTRRTVLGRDIDDRSVSTVLNYVLVLSISTVLVGGLLVAGGTFVEDNRERVINAELKVIGQHVAGNMEQVDRYVNASEANVDDGPEAAYINQSFQPQVTGSPYTIELVEGDPPRLVLTAEDPGIVVDLPVTVHTEVRDESEARGSGSISVYYDSDTEELVIDNA